MCHSQEGFSLGKTQLVPPYTGNLQSDSDLCPQELGVILSFNGQRHLT